MVDKCGRQLSSGRVINSATAGASLQAASLAYTHPITIGASACDEAAAAAKGSAASRKKKEKQSLEGVAGYKRSTKTEHRLRARTVLAEWGNSESRSSYVMEVRDAA